MAKYSESNVDEIYAIAERWKSECLIGNRSLLWPQDPIWTLENLIAFKTCFIDQPDGSKKTFEQKLEIQLSNASPDVIKLACELLMVYFLFPVNVSGRRKKELIRRVASWGNVTVAESALHVLESGIGDPGGRYNFNRPFELKHLALFALRTLELLQPERTEVLATHSRVREMLDQLQDENESVQIRHIILHLLFPDYYERIASGRHKRVILETFLPLVGADNVSEDPDDALYQIRSELETLLDGPLDFYRDPLRECWFVEGNADELDPLSALLIKKQVAFFGPPGTGKTHETKQVAATAVRRSILKAWGIEQYFRRQSDVNTLVDSRIRRVQFHPGYGYEEFVRGIHLVDGKTAYKNGVLLEVLADMEADHQHREIGFVVILDEMNRADLSKVLGECFSLIEDRGSPVLLGGHGEEYLSLPENLYFIGTMNLIDQSLEHVDFALRRRFLWFFRGYDEGSLVNICRERWRHLCTGQPKMQKWERVEAEFELFIQRCSDLNNLITNDNEILGPNYQIGHTYFRDIVDFAQQELIGHPKKQSVLFNKQGVGLEPVLALWKYSLEPLLEQYLYGLDGTVSKRWIANARSTFLGTK